ncbi:WYL domain-containing protein [Christiangramia forsetii]|uniref:WYL domain-containing protein n=1 Tax=Christiangramia forsetii TaxID=411153 RepID=UPI001E589EBA|nr:WYL domain-containing protein [Christiangramia forsetii]
MNSLPLHHSQELLSNDENEFQFSYYIRPTYHFRMEILSFDHQIKVLQPVSLRETISESLTAALNLY